MNSAKARHIIAVFFASILVSALSCKPKNSQLSSTEATGYFLETKSKIADLDSRIQTYYSQELKKRTDRGDDYKIPQLRIQGFIRILDDIRRDRGTAQQGVLNSASSLDSRRDIAIGYFANVVLPFRRVAVILNDFSANRRMQIPLTDELMITVPSDVIESFKLAANESIFAGNLPLGLDYLPSESGGFSTKLDYMHTLLRDAIALGSIADPDMYYYALQLMDIHISLSQVSNSLSLMGVDGAPPIPAACAAKVGDLVPAKLELGKHTLEDSDKYLDIIISRNGLMNDDPTHREYLVDFVRASPTEGGFSGLLPFENYFAAQRAISILSHPERKNLTWGYFQPFPNDFTHFHMTFAYLKIKALTALTTNENLRGLMIGPLKDSQVALIAEKQKEQQAILERRTVAFSNIVELVDVLQIKVGGEAMTAEPGIYTQAIAKKIEETGTFAWESWLTSETISQLKRSSFSISEFPGRDSSLTWRKWAMVKIRDALVKARNDSQGYQLQSLIVDSCSPSNNTFYTSVFCVDENKQHIAPEALLDHYIQIFSVFDVQSNYVPRLAAKWEEFGDFVLHLQVLWKKLVERQLIKDITFSEHEYLSSQYNDGNKWATLRISYLAALPSLQAMEPTVRGPVEKALETLGLNQIFSPNFGSRALDDSGQLAIWKAVVSEANGNSANLLISEGRASGNRDSYYQMIKRLADYPIFSGEDLSKALQQLNIQPDARTQQQLNEVLSSDLGQKSAYLIKMYNARGDKNLQEQVFAKYSELAGINSAFRSKMTFLEYDNQIKKPIYRQIFRAAANGQLKRANDSLGTICGFVRDQKAENKQEMFYGSQKAREQLSKSGIASEKIAELVTSELEEGDDFGSKNLYYSLGGAALFIGVIAVTTACTMAAGPLCLPLWHLAAQGMAAGAIGLQVAASVTDLQKKTVYDQIQGQLGALVKSGHTTGEQIDKMGVGWGMFIFDAASVIPMLRPVYKGLTSGSAALHYMAKNGFAASRSAGAKEYMATVLRNYDVATSRYLLGLASEGEFSLMIKAMKTGQVAASEVASAEILNKAFADNILKLFEKGHQKFLGTLAFADKVTMSRMGLAANLANNRTLVEGLRKVKWIGGHVEGWKTKILAKALSRQTQYAKLIEKAEKEIVSSATMEAFVRENVQALGDLFLILPVLTRELPYYALTQGSPLSKMNFSVLSKLNLGVALKRLAIARENLIFEKDAVAAAVRLGMAPNSIIHDSYDTMTAYRNSVLTGAVNGANAQATETLLAGLEIFDANMVQKIVASGKFRSLNAGQIRKALFYPDAEELATGKLLWNSIPPTELYDAASVPEFSHQVAESLRGYGNTSEFDDFLNAFRFTLIQKAPTSVAF
jgi:hypothetical protein